MKIAAIQSNLTWENREGNLKKFEHILGDIEHGTKLVVLPEMFTTGFSMKPENLAEEHPGKTVNWMKEMAIKRSFALTGSYIAIENGKYYNRMVFAFPTGEISTYDKRHLFRMAREDQHYTAGNQRVVVSYMGWRILLSVCYDLRFPVWLRNRNDYDLMVLVANFPEKRMQAWNTLLPARAIENQTYVVACNRVGNDGNNIFHSGDSQVIDPMGQVLAKAKRADEDVIYSELSMEYLMSIRSNFPVHIDADNFMIDLD